MRRLPALALAAMAACSRPAAPVDPAFAADWRRWHEEREERLRQPEGWLSLIGLHWLSEGENRIAGLPGRFVLERGAVSLEASAADGWTLGGAPLSGRSLLASDEAGEPDRLRNGARTAIVIERGDRTALRVWDTESAALLEFRGVPAYPHDPRWRVVGRWEPYPAPRTVEVPSAVGIPQLEQAPGRVHFELDGRSLTLEPTSSGDALFFVFRDLTSRDETYGAGRFLTAEPPVDGQVVLDFNRAVNPPCAFTPYATCPLPRPENSLPIRIEAGERRPAAH
ncbi:MAG TPA: DUF1684 domain-containing protein [Anaeromyxobacteraceae bacterium]|nr:DUF1684 domain-containing protein [Anaeromyxobacteraceae bacterium]